MYSPDCRRCLLAQATRSVCIPGEGPVPADLMLVGEAPGATEEAFRRPFVGDAGKMLDRLLVDAGISRSSVYITNTCLCRPPSNRNPAREEIEACKLYKLRELDTVHPKLIVALGGVAAEALTGKSGIGENRGKLLQLKPEYRSQVPVLVTYHPAAYLHTRNNAIPDNIAKDIKLALRILAGVKSQDKIICGLDEEESRAALKQLCKLPELACDCEWEVLGSRTGTKPSNKMGRERGWPWSRDNGRAPRLVSIGVAGELDGQRVGVSLPADSRFLPILLRVLKALPSIYHNAISDIVWLVSTGVTPVLAGDTLLLASLLNIEHSWSLKVLAPVYTDVDAGWEAKASSVVGTWPDTEVDWRTLLTYNAEDCVATWALNKRLLQMLHEQDRAAALPLYRQLLRAEVSLARAALRGTPIDEELLSRLLNAGSERLKRIKREVADELQVPGFAYDEPKSTLQLAVALEGKLGIRLPRTPKTGKPSLKVDNLLDHSRVPVVANLLELSKLKKLDSSYLRPWTQLFEEQGEPRLHTMYKLWSTRSGRTSTEGDAGATLQQFPRSSRVRKLVIAGDGYNILAADYSTVEMRLAAHLAQEPTLIRFFNEGIDVHEVTAAWVKASSSDVSLQSFLERLTAYCAAVTKEERQGAKAFNFGLLYGGGDGVPMYVARKDYGITMTQEQASAGRRGYFSLYSHLEPWHNSLWPHVRNGWVPTLLGRHLRIITSANEDSFAALRKAINLPVQSTASDLALVSLGIIDGYVRQEELDAWPIGFIHDAVLFEVADSALERVKLIIKQVMEQQVLELLQLQISVPLVVDIKVGKTWADAA